jgi:hypothetical protein
MADDIREVVRDELQSVITEAQEAESDAADAETLAEGDYPRQPVKDSIFLFWRELIKSKDTSKFGNLDLTELGSMHLSVRSYKDISLYLKYEGLLNADSDMTQLSNYFQESSEIALATSLSKKGMFIQNVVTMIKKTVTSAGTGEAKKKWSFLGMGRKSEGEGGTV